MVRTVSVKMLYVMVCDIRFYLLDVKYRIIAHMRSRKSDIHDKNAKHVPTIKRHFFTETVTLILTTAQSPVLDVNFHEHDIRYSSSMMPGIMAVWALLI